MIKIRELGVARSGRDDWPVTRAEYDILVQRVRELETIIARNAVTPTVTVRNATPVTRNGKSNAERQKAYRERRKGHE